MSISKQATVWCDICEDWFHNGGERTAKQVRKAARKEGWIRKDGKDRCPDCSKEEDR